MSSDDRICEHRWWASRVEVETAPVLHVCVEPEQGHPVGSTRLVAGRWVAVLLHRCACYATVEGEAHGHAMPPPPAAPPP